MGIDKNLEIRLFLDDEISWKSRNLIIYSHLSFRDIWIFLIDTFGIRNLLRVDI